MLSPHWEQLKEEAGTQKEMLCGHELLVHQELTHVQIYFQQIHRLWQFHLN